MNFERRNLKYETRVANIRSDRGPVAQFGRSAGTLADPTQSIWLLTRRSGVRTSSAVSTVALRKSPRARSALLESA